jgi:hypothetical protein
MCVHECVIWQLFRLPRSCMRVAKGTQLRWDDTRPFAQRGSITNGTR